MSLLNAIEQGGRDDPQGRGHTAEFADSRELVTYVEHKLCGAGDLEKIDQPVFEYISINLRKMLLSHDFTC